MMTADGLISTSGLAGLIAGSHAPVVLDARSGPDGAGRAQFEAGHIPGARHTDYAADGWRQRRDGAPGMLPDVAHLSGLFARLGLRPDLPVVIAPAGQGANDLAAAARIFWTLHHCGHGPLALLDGGMRAWIDEGRPLEHGPVPACAGAPLPVSFRAGVRATAGETLATLAAGTTMLVDGRAQSYFRGEEKAPEARAAGHLPGAISLDYVRCYDENRHRLKPKDELAQLFSVLPEGAPVISYCNTGHTAALNWFVLSQLLGRGDIRLYDGSMTEWTQDPSRPVAR